MSSKMPMFELLQLLFKLLGGPFSKAHHCIVEAINCHSISPGPFPYIVMNYKIEEKVTKHEGDSAKTT